MTPNTCGELTRRMYLDGISLPKWDATGGRLDEEELLKEIENVTESEDSDKATEDDDLPESIFEPNPNQKGTSHVLQVAQQVIQAVEDDSDESDVGEEPEEPEVSLMTPLTSTSKVSRRD